MLYDFVDYGWWLLAIAWGWSSRPLGVKYITSKELWHITHYDQEKDNFTLDVRMMSKNFLIVGMVSEFLFFFT